MLKKMLAVLMTVCLLGQNMVFASTQAPDKKSLQDVQAQAKADFNTFRQKYGKETKYLLPAVVAAGPLLLTSMTREQLIEQITILSKQLEKGNAQYDVLASNFVQVLKKTPTPEKTLENILSAEFSGRYGLQAREAIYIKADAENVLHPVRQLVGDIGVFRMVDLYEAPIINIDKVLLPKIDASRYVLSKSKDAVTKESEAIAEKIIALMNVCDPIAQQEIEGLLYVGTGRKFATKNADYLAALAGKYSVFNGGRLSLKPEYGDYTTLMVSLRKMLFSQGTPKARALGISLGKRILSKAGLLGVGLFALGGISALAAETTSTQDMALARRIVENPELFINADEQALATIQANELAANTARELAQVMHTAVQLIAEGMQTISQLYELSEVQYEQKLTEREIKKSISSSLKTVKAH